MWTKKCSEYWHKDKSNYKNTLLFSMNFGVINGFKSVKVFLKNTKKMVILKDIKNTKNY